ncbi:VOC family protein [Phytomonospora endophytica]|uniref:Catechol 2,3-dioxygenase-like lactoylglutathione lyase family enzyme n=1 Tax=Phytomonospora endophytica TaxID=714109 RepID=A0A841FUW3_9ACTN|nr:VOC family protein [Phytomonospora endophytica]MBB6035770.1 catechol 2,3-dioxygenase-like lactoylglutathione lyase family enzyme [Phytomonospora endophytica]GIG69551.1 glyoxalase [Phytomonospora endophytica]
MKVTSTAISLNVDDVTASADFARDHLGYERAMAADGFVSLKRGDAAVDLIFLRRGIEVLPEGLREQHTAGLIVALVVDDIATEYDRLSAEGVPVVVPLRTEEWGERLFVVADPNGVHYEFVQWITPEAGDAGN